MVSTCSTCGCHGLQRFTSLMSVFRILYGLFLLQLLMVETVTGFTLVTMMTTFKPLITDATKNQTSYVGGVTILHCTVINLGTRSVIWRKVGKTEPITIGTMTFTADNRFQMVPVPHSEQWNLVIKDVQHKDAGDYECQIASTDRGIRELVHLNVLDSPVAKPGIQISPILYVEKGDRIVLSCNATASDLDWYKRGLKVTTNPDLGIRIRKQAIIQQNMVISFLEIEKATMDDDSDYVCRSSDLMNANVKVHVINAGTMKEKREQNDIKSETGSSYHMNGSDAVSGSVHVCAYVVAMVTILNSWTLLGT